MKTTTLKKAAVGALLMAGTIIASTPAAKADISVGIGIGGPAYVDPCYGPYPYPYYCSYPVFYGPVFYAGRWHDGVHRYRVVNGHRHYYVGGGWHKARVGHGRHSGPRQGRHDGHRAHGRHRN